MFITNEDTIDIKIYVHQQGKAFKAYTEEEYKDLNVKADIKEAMTEVNIQARLLTWGLHNDLQEIATVELANGTEKFDYKKFKETKLERIIISWDAKKDGKPVPVNANTIKSLAPDVAEAILKAYNEESYVGDKLKKK